MIRRLASCGLIVSLALAGAACSRRGSAITQLSGAEAQRISFGAPHLIHANFSEKINACWFNGHNPLLNGYRVDARPMFASAEGQSVEGTASTIRIYAERGVTGQPDEGFEVQFHPYNNNTLISTRNLSLPPELAARLKHDIETWIFGGNDCGDGAPPPPNEPAIQQPRLQRQSA